MELPFAVDSDSPLPADDSSSLMTASSQGSFVPADDLNLSQQNDEDEVVFAEPMSPQPNRNPEPFRPTIAALPPVVPPPQPLPPNPPILSTTPAPLSSIGSGGAALISGVDALKSAGSRVSSVLSHFGYNRSATTTTAAVSSNHQPRNDTHSTISSTRFSTTPASEVVHSSTIMSVPVGASPNNIDDHPDTEAIEFAYINVTDEDEVDIWLDDSNTQYCHNDDGAVGTDATVDAKGRGDILTALLTGGDAWSASDNAEKLVTWTEQANEAAALAVTAKKEGNLQQALDLHSDAAKHFHNAAVHVRDRDVSMANSLLLLSHTQAKSAMALKRIVKLRPNAFSSSAFQSNNRLRATVRGALNSSAPEADISDSAFLGKASKPPVGSSVSPSTHSHFPNETDSSRHEDSKDNPVDEMLELERELREMDMTLALGNSIASLDARTQNRMKSSVSDSFMVIPGAGSYMSSSSSSIILGPAAGGANSSRPGNIPNFGGTAGVRARANRVQSLGRPVAAHPPPITAHNVPPVSLPKIQTSLQPPQSLESSWWGNVSMMATSQVISASVSTLAGAGPEQSPHQQQQHQPANTKQLMRLMDSLRTLGDENAALLREVEDAEAARVEAKTAREQMKRFKEEYGKRFAALKEALEKFRKGYPGDNSSSGDPNPVTSSEFSRSASASDQILRQEQLIRKLTADLKKEKEEGKKKDGALRKYESFYREVKARSAQKAAQRQQHQQTQQPTRASGYQGSVR